MFSFAMTSGLASDSDKFKIIITLCWAQKFGDTGPYKNLVFSFNPLVPEVFCNFSQNPASLKKDAGALMGYTTHSKYNLMLQSLK